MDKTGALAGGIILVLLAFVALEHDGGKQGRGVFWFPPPKFSDRWG